MADATYAPALIGLLGVIVGAVITAGANFILAVRKERADKTRESANREREVQRAARLVSLELAQARDKWGSAIEHHAFLDVDEIIKTEAWDAHKTILADHLPIKDWNALAEGFRTISQVERLISADTASYALYAAELPSMHLRIIVACEVAQQYAGSSVI
jgi:hypothetical protein